MNESDYINVDYCEFNNDASAASFGWDFQSNAGIFLFLQYIKDAKGIKLESKLQDIEITLSNGDKVLAQAKSAQDYTTAHDKKEKFKDAIISLAKFSKHGDKLIYISNIPDTFNNAKDCFNNKIVAYSECLQGMKDEIDKLIESTCESMHTKILKEKDSGKKQKKESILKCVKEFDKTKLYISVIAPYFGDEQNRYSEISNAILSFLVNNLEFRKDDAIAIKQKLLEHWQLKFQHNSSQPDLDTIKKEISKEDFAWPIAVFLSDEDCVNDVEECLSFSPDKALIQEVKSDLQSSEIIYHERFEFSNRVIQDFTLFRNESVVGRDIEKRFVKEHGNDYYDEFERNNDKNKTEYLTKAFIFRILTNYRNIAKIKAGIGV